MGIWANPFDPFPFRLASVKWPPREPWYFTAVWVVNQPHNGAIQRPSNKTSWGTFWASTILRASRWL